MKYEIRIAVDQSKDTPVTICQYVRGARRIVEAVQEATPGWKLWQTGPLRVAVAVLRTIEGHVCGS